MTMPIIIKFALFIIVAIVILSISLDSYLCSDTFTNAGQFIVFAFTLIVLIIYAYDTHRIANATEQKWEEELKPKLSYEMFMNTMDEDDVIFRLTNSTDYFIEVIVNCNLKVYGEDVSYPGAYDGSEKWRVFPHQISQGHFSIESVLSKKGKSRQEMAAESTTENETVQMTMDLEIQFENETGRKREYPPRRHYFVFSKGVWVPELTTKNILA